MSKFRNVSPSGDLDVPLLGRVIKAGEVFDATEEQAALLIEQPGVWQIVKEKAE